jgi:biotin operon repressor
MNLEKFLGSKTKSDIIKYLVFKRQGVSMRALEQELSWTFPAIKKQIDSLQESDILIINKDAQARSIELDPLIAPIIVQLVMVTLKQSCEHLLNTYDSMISTYYYGKLFGMNTEQDLVVLYTHNDPQCLEQIKKELNILFHDFFIDHASVVFMSEDEFRKRINMADKFALGIMR